MLLAVTAAKLPDVETCNTGEEFVSLGGLLGVLLTSADLLLIVDVVLLPLELKIELLLLFIVALDARTAVGLIGYNIKNNFQILLIDLN